MREGPDAGKRFEQEATLRFSGTNTKKCSPGLFLANHLQVRIMFAVFWHMVVSHTTSGLNIERNE